VIRLLTFTSLYPNTIQPRHGLFVEERLRQLLAVGDTVARVVAPVPWFPFRNRGFGLYSRHASVPQHEMRHGIEILHPRYPAIPKLGMSVAPFLMVHALLPILRNLGTSGQGYDLIDAHYFYPDGVAAVRLAQRLGKPVVVTARGTDINLIARYHFPRRQIIWAVKHAHAVVAVSKALKESLVALGVTADKITVLRNGVDLERFHPLERSVLQGKFKLTSPVWLFAGHLVRLKGVHIIITALADIPDVTLLIAGFGPEESRLRQLADSLGVAYRIRFLGEVSHADLCEYYNATDVLVLASSREGMPNVVLEALACGTPVIATRVGGTPELVSSPEAGELMQERTPEALVAAWHRLRTRKPERMATRKFAERFGWGPTISAQQALYTQVLSGFGSAMSNQPGGKKP